MYRAALNRQRDSQRPAKFEFKRAKNLENRGPGGYPIGFWDQKWTKFRSWMLLWLLSCLGGVLESLKKFWEAFWDRLERLLGPNLGPKTPPKLPKTPPRQPKSHKSIQDRNLVHFWSQSPMGYAPLASIFEVFSTFKFKFWCQICARELGKFYIKF